MDPRAKSIVGMRVKGIVDPRAESIVDAWAEGNVDTWAETNVDPWVVVTERHPVMSDQTNLLETNIFCSRTL